MSSLLTLRPADECRFDLVSLGEVMLRLDPGERADRDDAFVHGVGGGRRVQRRPRPQAVLRSSHRDRDRARRQSRRPARRRSHLPGRCRAGTSRVGALRRRGAGGAQRAQLHRARFRCPRRPSASPTAGTPPSRSCAAAMSTGSRSSAPTERAGSTAAASSPLSPSRPQTSPSRRWRPRAAMARSSRTTSTTARRCGSRSAGLGRRRR